MRAVLAAYHRFAGGLPGEVAGTTMRHYLFGGGRYAADLCGDLPIPLRTATDDTAANGVQTAMRNDVQTAHLDAYERMLEGMREVVARMQEGEEASARELYARLIQDYARTVFQAGMNAYQSRQADMIQQWKDSAKKDGWATYGMWFWQLSEGTLAVSTAINEMTPEQQGFRSELTSLTKETADQVRLAVARNDALIESLYARQATGTQQFASWRAVQNESAHFNYAVPRGGRAFSEDFGHAAFQWLGASFQEAFRWMLPSVQNEFPLLTWYRFGHTLMDIGVGAMVAGAGLGLFSSAVGLLLVGLGGFVYALGWLLAIFLGYLPLVMWVVQLISWLIEAVIAAFGMPLWMLMHLSGEGDGISGARAQSGYGRLLSLLLRPVLLVFGLYAAIALLYVVGWFVEQTFGTTLQNPPNSVFESLGLIVMYVLAIVALATLCLRTIARVPELAFHWIDVVLSHVGASAQAEAETGLRAGGRGIPGSGDRLVNVAGPVGRKLREWLRK